ncbi:MAG: carboxypeptidase-like regulatory domain-containing protein, partial [Bacteroidota bacterium]
MRKKSMSAMLCTAMVALLSLSAVQLHAEKISLSKNSTNFERPPVDVTGTVSDVRNAPLAGATVTIKGTRISTVTDQNGKFSLRGVSDGAVLQISFSGYLTEEVQAAAGAMKVTLREQINQLTDVVVVGYGTQRKKDLTGAVVQVKASQLENENARSVQDMLRGNAPGLDVGFNASPKGGGDLRVRGRASLTASTTPLIVVDGVIYQGDLSDINP